MGSSVSQLQTLKFAASEGTTEEPSSHCPSLQRPTPVRFVCWDDLRSCSTIPTYSNQAAAASKEPKNIAADIESIRAEREDSVFIFVSHTWRDCCHEDSLAMKLQLIVEGVHRIKENLCPGMNRCYLWWDSACLDYDDGEVCPLEQVMALCDCIFTPIADPNWRQWDFDRAGVYNHYDQYKAELWNSFHDHAYLNRAWCRLEMLYAANLPVDISSSRVYKFSRGFRHHACINKRPHILFGEHELHHRIDPIVLAPFQNQWFESMDPRDGTLTHRDDMLHIEMYLAHLQQHYMVIHPYGYQGPNKFIISLFTMDIYNDGILCTPRLHHGPILNRYAHGEGVYRFHSGAVFEGHYVNGRRQGHGKFTFASGSVYEGDYKDDKMDGFGIYNYASGDVFEGDYLAGQMCGRGVYKCASSGDIYEGEMQGDRRHGKGVLFFRDGSVYEGDFRDGMRHGYGTHHKFVVGGKKKKNRGHKNTDDSASSPQLELYEGEYQYDKPHGHGTYTYASGEKWSGQWEDGYPLQRRELDA